MKKIQPKDIITKYTEITSGELEIIENGFFTNSLTIQDWFGTAQEAHEWEAKVKQFILENRNDTRTS